MNQIQGLFNHIDWFSIATAVIGLVTGLSFFSKLKSKVKQLSDDITHIIDQANKDLQTGTFTKEEVMDILNDLRKLLSDFKA